jgi:hypothetical protein
MAVAGYIGAAAAADVKNFLEQPARAAESGEDRRQAGSDSGGRGLSL